MRSCGDPCGTGDKRGTLENCSSMFIGLPSLNTQSLGVCIADMS